MRLIFDTHLLLRAAAMPERLTEPARRLLEDPGTEPVFSSASLWEIVIKAVLGRADFTVAPEALWRGLMANGYEELPVNGRHTLAVAALPPLHRDPLDRLLVAQAQVEEIGLVTSDAQVAAYPGHIRLV